MSSADLSRVRQLIRDVPDFPKPGVLFKDIAPLLGSAEEFAEAIDALAAPYLPANGRAVVDKVVGIEARGFILAAPVAYRCKAGFVPVRKAGKLPWRVEAQECVLEYGTAMLEVHEDAIVPGERVLIVDDVLATGGTGRATAMLVERLGGKVVGVLTSLEIEVLGGRQVLADYDVSSLLRY